MSTHTVRTPAGTMAYTDVGSGPPVVLLHGNPTSARLYRHLLPALAPTHRCVAPDLLGFGRSDAPASCSYRPPAHAARVEALLRRLDLDGLTLVLHDWGGPIGLSFALRHPERVRRLVLMNTWMWPLSHRPRVQAASRLVGSAAGRWAVERHNAFVRLVMPATLGPDAPRCPDWLGPYADALDTRARRRACWTFARSLLADTEWLRRLWTHRDRLADRPVLLCWGRADPAFGTAATLRRWTALFSEARVRSFPRTGHYVPEELGPRLRGPVQSFLRATAP
jgi:haloalkane dehalogenase